jgi:hypothetical protein
MGQFQQHLCGEKHVKAGGTREAERRSSFSVEEGRATEAGFSSRPSKATQGP